MESFNVFISRFREVERAEFVKRAGFSEEQVDEYEAAFKQFDVDGGGTLSIQEINPILNDLGKAPKTVQQRKRLMEMIAEIDSDNTGEIDFLEFLQLMRKFVTDRDAEYMRKEKNAAQRAKFSADETKAWRTIFLKFDADGSGAFDANEGKAVLQAVGINLNERSMHDQYLRLFKEVDE